VYSSREKLSAQAKVRGCEINSTARQRSNVPRKPSHSARAPPSEVIDDDFGSIAEWRIFRVDR
jgi:hypothetical protein